ETKQHGDDLCGLRDTVRGIGGDPIDQREQRRLDELDQTFEHLRLAGEMAIERRLRHAKPGRERSGRDLLATRALQHRRERLQYLESPLTRFGCHCGTPLATPKD